MYIRRRTAFTLVELLIVIGIIAVLIALLLPVLGKAAESARQIKCASNERQIYAALEMYSTENKSFLPIPPLIGQTNSWFMFPCPATGVIDYTSGTLWTYLEPSQARDLIFTTAQRIWSQFGWCGSATFLSRRAISPTRSTPR